jgi:class 3 adenylate cyclase
MLSRLRPIDRVLVLTLVPLWVVCFGLSIKTQLAGGGIAAIGLSVEDHASYPVVTGEFSVMHISSPLEASGLEPGDRLIRAGELDLRGLGTTSFMSTTRDASNSASFVALTYERDGHRRETRLPLVSVSLFRSRLAASISLAALVLFLLLRTEPSRMISTLFHCGLASAFTLTFFVAGPLEAQLWVSAFVAGTSLTLPHALRFVQLFPGGRAPTGRWQLAWPWLFAAPGLFAAVLFSGRVALGETGMLLWTTAGGVALLAMGSQKYRAGDARTRRQIKWVLLGGYFGMVPLVLGALLAAYDPDFGRLPFEATWAFPLLPLAFLFSIARYNLFDIDRVLSATAAYNVVIVALVGTGLVLVPRTGVAAAGLLGLTPASGQLAFSLLLAALVVPAQRRLRPQIERIFFKQRYALDHGIAELLPAIATCSDARDLVERLGEGLVALIGPETCVIYARSEASYAPVFAEGRAIPPAFEAASPLVGTLQERRRPLALAADGRQPDRAALGPFDRAALETLDAEVVVPIRRGDALAAFLCLGPRRSRDVYTTTDLSLLAAVGETTAHQLERLDQQQVAREAQAMRDELRRYVPGAVAERLESGADLESESREVSVLFVDIRGFTGLSEGRSAEEIFSTVNRYTERVSQLVRDAGGSVVEFNGDGMMAVFGAPEPLAQKERAAVRAAREIVDEIGSIETGDLRLSVGVGIATGDAYVGSVRAADRLIWSAIGNTTNLAARLQALSRDLDAAIVIDDGTWQALAEYERMGFVHHAKTAVRGRSDPHDVHALPLPGNAARAIDAVEGEDHEFRLVGQVWKLAYAGHAVQLQDAKGLHFLRRLLETPHQEVHVLDLVAGAEDGAPAEPSGRPAELVADGLGIQRVASEDELLDPEARSAYRARLEELRDELSEAEEFHDTGRAARAREEMDFLERELAGAVGLGGRARRSSGPEERARKAVYSRVRHALRTIAELHPELGKHLEAAVRTGVTCVYRPEHAPDWRLG